MGERNFVRGLMTKLKKIPDSWWYKIPDPVPCPKCGVSGLGAKRPFDIVGCIASTFVALEAKTSSKSKVLPHQVANLELVNQAGGYARVVYPENAGEVITALRELRKFSMDNRIRT